MKHAILGFGCLLLMGLSWEVSGDSHGYYDLSGQDLSGQYMSEKDLSLSPLDPRRDSISP